jgi:hypothetical protein
VELFFIQLAEVIEEALWQLKNDTDVDASEVNEVEITPEPYPQLPHGSDLWTVIFPQFEYRIQVRAWYRDSYFIARYQAA